MKAADIHLLLPQELEQTRCRSEIRGLKSLPEVLVRYVRQSSDDTVRLHGELERPEGIDHRAHHAVEVGRSSDTERTRLRRPCDAFDVQMLERWTVQWPCGAISRSLTSSGVSNAVRHRLLVHSEEELAASLVQHNQSVKCIGKSVRAYSPSRKHGLAQSGRRIRSVILIAVSAAGGVIVLAADVIEQPGRYTLHVLGI